MTPSFLFVRKNSRHHKLSVNDILFVRAHGSYVEITTRDDKFSVALNLTQFARKNPIDGLLRVHRSFIVNIYSLDSFDHEFIYVGEHQVPIGDSFRQKFIKDIRSF